MAYFMPNKFKDTVMSRWLVLAVFVQAAHGYGSPKPGDRVCRFYSDMRKSCQSKCVDLTEAEVNTIIAARRTTDTGTVGVNVKEIQNAHIDPILFIKCVGTKTVTSWDVSQGFVAFMPSEPDSAYAKAGVYVGACLFKNDNEHSWSCRGCDRQMQTTSGKAVVPVPQSCFIGGEDQYKGFYKVGWKQNGPDESTLKLFHPAR